MKKIIPVIIIIFLPLTIRAQNIAFHHLKKTTGLTSYAATCAVTDKNGFLWIGTMDGLNVYDGYSVTNFFKEKEPALASHTINELTCDRHNRIWICTPKGASMVDSSRRIQLVKPDTFNTYRAKNIIETRSAGIILFTDKGEYSLDEETQTWKKMEWTRSLLSDSIIRLIIPYKNDEYFILFVDHVLHIDFASQRSVSSFYVKDVRTGTVLNDNELLLGDYTSHLIYYNIPAKKITRKYELNYKENGILVSENIWCMRRSSENEIFIGTSGRGLIRLDTATGNRTYFRHDPGNPYSIGFNSINTMYCAPDGNVVLISQNEGVDIFNSKIKAAVYSKLIIDVKGNTYDNQIYGIAEDESDNIWIGAFDRLICWNRKSNTYNFFYYPYTDERFYPAVRYISFNQLLAAKNNRIWFTTVGAGFGYFNTLTHQFKTINPDTIFDKGAAIRTRSYTDLQYAPDSAIWFGSRQGIFRFDPGNFSLNTFYDHPLLNIINKVSVNKIYFDRMHRMWIGTANNGAYCYDEKKQSLKHYSVDNGLANGNVYAFAEDDNDNMYMATDSGLSVFLKNGRIKNFSAKNGLKSNFCTGIVKDEKGFMWIADDYYILRYNPADSSFLYFDENSGISKEGFRPFTFCKTNDGLMLWGTTKGFNYFYPQQMQTVPQPLKPMIIQATEADSVFHFTGNSEIRLPHNRNTLNFYFTAIAPTGANNILYEYLLEGADKKWIRTEAVRNIQYSSLSPGTYIFKVRASVDAVNWTDSVNKITLIIAAPFWQTWWFRLAMILITAFIIFMIFKARINYIKQRQAEKIEIMNKDQAIAEKELVLANLNHDLAVTKLTALRAQMNPHFIFNSLNSIQQMILRGEETTATRYLSKFSKLLRIVLLQSDKTTVTLNEEIETLNLYLELEALRYSESFEYSVDADSMIDKEDTEIPTLLVQPFVENAIWHGLMHKQGARKLHIHFGLNNEEQLVCTIDDNGIGRDAAARIFEEGVDDISHTGKGVKATEERLHLYNQQPKTKSSLKIIDKKDKGGNAAGTTIVITLPEIN